MELPVVMGRSCSAPLKVCVLLAVIFLPLLVRQRPMTRPPVELGGGQRRWEQCQRVLRTGQVRHSWEQPAADLCRKRQWTPYQARRALQRLARRRGRDARVVLVGDSRVRIVHMKMKERVRLTDYRRDFDLNGTYPTEWRTGSHETVPLRMPALSEDCVEVFVLAAPKAKDGSDDRIAKARCSIINTGAHLRNEFWWRPWLDELYGRRLDELADECWAGRCPDLVVLDGGAWYAVRKRGLDSGQPTAWVARFAAELAALQPRLARLAAATPVLWKLDELYMTEALRGHKSGVTGTLMALAAALHETAALVPQLVVWSSGVTEATRFYHSVCLPLELHRRPTFTGPVRDECLDPTHVGSTVRWLLAETLFDVLLMDVTPPVSGYCC
ncbi:uncharacterized protein LOC119110247 [Pollicipes pollicipes]|uniref:uncharacterized protein LOC119110247 n=1 Tax=Pollicipes pollicipes TaxID=41117 RepID=UPI001884B57B|nr:uncharacterized protein LOC119110247 [Pollicipes pollicipes]XP_037089889.1 uncharacterized protein LOC119110247 [Pollicipes pollicipes]XP_037089890.1 uncharacterized protein LOC119110247 [Pollicipes pollicipes]XP_037089891.1 uncharacterized protein LOC119110247 [Pollicipes pollicipes]XP_037089892.1 uncharacterized protein LOC119110247 [Pollicipes pollicipes]XP_037089893.1 uncharacterized protein LOC119110247 [Pollicipes pollicipes]XP_037089895.1 uncharacterized protein LOC119110247 [Pollic